MGAGLERGRESDDMRRCRYRRCLKLCGVAAAVFVMTSLASLSTLSPPVVTPAPPDAGFTAEIRHTVLEAMRTTREPEPPLKEGHVRSINGASSRGKPNSTNLQLRYVDEQSYASREAHESFYKFPKRKYNTSFETVSALGQFFPSGNASKSRGPQLFTQADCDQWIKSQRASLMQAQGEDRYDAGASDVINGNTNNFSATTAKTTSIVVDNKNNNNNRAGSGKDRALQYLPHQQTGYRQPGLPTPQAAGPHPPGGSPEVSVVILVVSSPSHVQNRQAIRATWGWEPPEGVEVVFLLGADTRWDDITAREQRLHKDVVRVATRDTYRGLPRKVLAGLRWLKAKRPGRGFYVKVDDDVYVHVPALLALLRGGAPRDGEVVGALAAHSLVIRDPQHKWYVSPKDFPCPLFPPYVLGGAYAMTGATMGRLLKAAAAGAARGGKGGGGKMVVPVEDVLVTGLLAWKAGVRPVDHPAFPVYWLQPRPSAADLIAGRKVVCINVAPAEILELDGQIQAYYRQLFQSRRANARAT